MSTWFYYNEKGEKIAVTGGQLKGLAKAGLISPETVVETEGGKTALAKKVKGLTFVELTVEMELLSDNEKSVVSVATEETYEVKLPPPKPSPFTASMSEAISTPVADSSELENPFTGSLSKTVNPFTVSLPEAVDTPVAEPPESANPFTASMPVVTESAVPLPVPPVATKPESPFTASMPRKSPQ